MSSFRDFKLSLAEITAIAIDTHNANYLWIAYKKNSSGVVLLQKVSAYDPTQVYFNISVPVNGINAIKLKNNLVFLACDHSTIFAYAYSNTNPLTSWSFTNRPSGVHESPVDIGVGSTHLYFLTPGSISGEVAKLINIDQNNNFVETITIQTSGLQANNAKAVTVDGSENAWVVNDAAISSLFRVYQTSGGMWNFAETVLV